MTIIAVTLVVHPHLLPTDSLQLSSQLCSRVEEKEKEEHDRTRGQVLYLTVWEITIIIYVVCILSPNTSSKLAECSDGGKNQAGSS